MKYICLGYIEDKYRGGVWPSDRGTRCLTMRCSERRHRIVVAIAAPRDRRR